VTLTDGKLGTDGAIMKARELVKAHPENYFMPDQFSNAYNRSRMTGRPEKKSGTNQRQDRLFCLVARHLGQQHGRGKVLKEA